MEDTLWVLAIGSNIADFTVLILVLMEDTLWAKKKAAIIEEYDKS